MAHNYDPLCFCSDCSDYEHHLRQQIRQEKKLEKKLEKIPVTPDLQLELVIPAKKR